MEGLNLDSLTVDDKGRVFFSGLTTNIDFAATVDAIMAAKRIPIDQIEARVTDNEARSAALVELRTLLNGLTSSLGNLRGAVTADNSADIFKAKAAFATTSRSDGQTPAAAANLVGVSVTNATTLGSHTIEVLRVAAAHKLTSDAQASATTALGTTGTFTVNGKTVTVSTADTLQDVRDRINATNTGTSPSKVSASIVAVSATENFLVLTANQTGTAMTLEDTSGTPLGTIGVLTGANIKNLVTKAETARFKADGFVDTNRHETDFVTSKTADLDTLFTTATYPGSFTVDGNTINYTSTSDLTSLAVDINAISGITSQAIDDGSGFRLEIVKDDGSAMVFVDTNGLLAKMGLNNEQIFERTSNTITDLFVGTTLTLFQSQEDTTIKIDIDRDLTAVNAEITDFVTEYNKVKVFLNTQSQIDPETGLAAEGAGVLFGSSVIADVNERLGKILGAGAVGVDSAFAVLPQIGIDFVDNAILSEPLNEDTLQINTEKLSAALLSNPDDVRRMFAFDFSPSDSRALLLANSARTTFNASGYTLNVNFDDRFQSAAKTNTFSFTQVDADTGGPAEDGISAIAYTQTVATGKAFRYSYNQTTEVFTLYDLTVGTNQAIDITSIIDAATGAGQDLANGETATVDFSNLGVTFTLTGSGGTPFVRGTDILNGVTDTGGTGASNGGIFAGLSTVSPTTGLNKTAIDALVASGVFTQATGLLTLGITSSGAGVSSFSTAAGITFTIDGAGLPASADISGINLDDGGPHTVEIFITDGGIEKQVAQLSFTTLSGSIGAGSGSFTVDLGTGLFGETAALTTGKDAPMSNYYTITDGSFEIRDNTNALLGTVSFNAADSLTDLAGNITANILGVTASIVEDLNNNTFRIEIVDANHDVLTFVEIAGGLVAELNTSNVGTTVRSANINGPSNGIDDGTATVTSGNAITATSLTAAEGLKVLYTGITDLNSITLNFTIGVGAQLHSAVQDLLDSTGGAVETRIDTLADQTKAQNKRIAEMLVRLDLQRQRLIRSFQVMETALASLQRIKNSITEIMKGIFASR